MNKNSSVKKRVLSLLIAVVIVVGTLPLCGITSFAILWQTNWYVSGTGTEADPYIIQDVAGLEGLAAAVNGGADQKGKYIKLADDFDNTGSLTTTISNNISNPFKGNFDGNGKVVTLSINETNANNLAGFFGYANGSILKNVFIKGVITANCAASGIAYYCINTSIINCASNVSIAGNINAGGISGPVTKTNIINCYENANLTNTGKKGLFTWNTGTSYATSSYSTHPYIKSNNGQTADMAWKTITDAQMKLASGETDALVDKLNAYALSEEGKAAGLLRWAINPDVNDGYPFLVSPGTDLYDFYKSKDKEIAKLENEGDFQGIIAKAIDDINDLEYDDEISCEANKREIKKIARKAIKDMKKAFDRELQKDAEAFKEEVDEITNGRVSNFDQMIKLINNRVGTTIKNIIQGFFDYIWSGLFPKF